MKRFLLIALCLGFAGCATMSSQMNSITVGMKKDEVIKVMGEPTSTSAKKGLEYLNYELTETSHQWWYGFTTPYFVAFKDGKVIAFGRTGDFGTTARPKEIIELDQNVTTSPGNNGDNADLESKLKTLNKLLADGVITQDDFNQQKAKLLNEYTSK